MPVAQSVLTNSEQSIIAPLINQGNIVSLAKNKGLADISGPNLPRNGEFKHEVHEIVNGLRNMHELQALASKRSERWIDVSVHWLSRPIAVWAQAGIVGAWMAYNVVAAQALRFDPYPYLFLNAVFSVISGFTTVLVLNSNRKEEANIKEQTRLEAKSFELTLKLLSSIESRLEKLEQIAEAKEPKS